MSIHLIVIVLTYIFILLALFFIANKLNKSWLAYCLLGIEITIFGTVLNNNIEPFIVTIGLFTTIIGFLKNDN